MQFNLNRRLFVGACYFEVCIVVVVVVAVVCVVMNDWSSVWPYTRSIDSYDSIHSFLFALKQVIIVNLNYVKSVSYIYIYI